MTPEIRVLLTAALLLFAFAMFLAWAIWRAGEREDDSDVLVPAPTSPLAASAHGRDWPLAGVPDVRSYDPRDPLVEDPEDPFSATELAGVCAPERPHRDASLFVDQISTRERLAAAGPQRRVNPWLAL